MPNPRGAMAAALREAFASAPSTQQAIQEQQEKDVDPSAVQTEQTQEQEPAQAIEESAVEAQAEIGDEDGREIEYINDLPSALGWEPEQFYGLKVKLAEEQDPVPFGEIKDRLQSVEKEREEIGRQRAEIEQQREKLRQQAMQFGQANQAVTERMAKAQQIVSGIQAQYQQKAAQWEKERQLEPGKVALEQQELGQAYAAAQQEYQAAAMEAQQRQGAAREQWLHQQAAILGESIPEWREPEKRQKLQQDLTQFAQQRYGATQDELRNIDAKTLLLLKDAMEGVKLKKGATEAVQKVKAAPRVVPRGLRMRANAETRRDVAERINRARETKTRRDITDAVRGVLGEALATKK